MVREKKEISYSQENVKRALDAIQKGASIRQASKDFKVPFTTLRSRHNGTYSLTTRKGPSTVLSQEEEHNLIKWMLHLETSGHPQTKNQLLDSVQIICKNLKKKTPFINNRPSKRWYNSFLKRHKEVLSQQTSKNLPKKRVVVTEKNLRLWFEETATYLESKSLLNIDSSRIFNLNESAFCLAPKNDKVIVIKRSLKVVYNDNKNYLTIMIVSNAKGRMSPGLVIFKGAKLPANIVKFLPKTFVAGKSGNGWMTGENFYEYMVNIFYPWCVNEKVVFPIIIYVDGHSSYLTFPLSEFCADKKIEIIPLYPNATHLMQPLNVALFEPLKTEYMSAVETWRRDHNGDCLKKENFANVVTTAFRSLDLEKILNQGFEVCGLHPFSADAIDYSRTLGHPLEEKFEPKNEEVMEDDNDMFVDYIEKNIENETLELFRKSAVAGVWHGPEYNRGLFEFWLKSCNNDQSNYSDSNPGELITALDPSYVLVNQENE